MPYETLILEKKETVLIVTFNRPDKKNALSPQVAKELESLFHSVGHHGNSARAMVLRGGEGIFCAGLDLEFMKNVSDHDVDHYLHDISHAFLAMQQASFPIIAEIDGPAFGAGFDFCVMSDIRLASPKARFCQPEIKVGIPPLIDPLWKIIGLGRAREMGMTGMVVDAEEAYRMGLVNRIIPSEHLHESALELAAELAGRDPEAMETTKRACRLIPGMETVQALTVQMSIFEGFLDSEAKRNKMVEYFQSIRKR